MLLNFIQEKLIFFLFIMNFLHIACKEGFLPIIKLLILKKFDINTRINENSPLHFASIYGNIEIVKYFHQNGAQLDIINDVFLFNNCLFLKI